MRTNSIKRINHQRDKLIEGLNEANETIIYCIVTMMKFQIFQILIFNQYKK